MPSPRAVPAFGERRRPAAPQSVVDQVTDTILEEILAGSLAPGDPVAISELSEQLDVSHVPVREALRRLEGRGLVIFRRGRRPQISPVDPQDFEALFHLRAVVEADVAARSGSMLGPKEVGELRELNAQLADALRRGEPRQASAVHTRLHLALLPAASRWDRQILEQIWAGSERYLQIYLGDAERNPRVVKTTIDVHDELVAVAEAATPKTLRAAVLDHIEVSRRELLPAIEAASSRAA